MVVTTLNYNLVTTLLHPCNKVVISVWELSKFDQISLKNLYDEWVKSEKPGKYFFRPYIKQDVTPTTMSSENDIPPDTNTQFPQTLLWIYQEEWQQNLLIKYGNTMTLIDATYKTTKYDLPLFFVTVRTNVGYKVVIVQSETTEQVLEALNFLKTWTPQWNPSCVFLRLL